MTGTVGSHSGSTHLDMGHLGNRGTTRPRSEPGPNRLCEDARGEQEPRATTIITECAPGRFLHPAIEGSEEIS